MTEQEMIERLDFIAKVKFDGNARAGRKGKDWAIETEIEWQAARMIERLMKKP